MPKLPLYAETANSALRTFNALCLPDIIGQPCMEEACGDWFKEIVQALFGSLNPATNVREFREVFVLVSKGSSKTTYGAGLMITALLQSRRRNVEFLLIGPTQAIAETAYSAASGMVMANEFLSKRLLIKDHVKEIKDRVTGSRLKIKTFDRNVLTGSKPAGVMLDELHVLGRDASAIKVIRQIRGGLEKNTDGFLFITTTQSDESPTGAFLDELKAARAVRDGRFEGRTLPILYEFPPDLQRDETFTCNPDNWPLVMPNLGRSTQLASLIHDYRGELLKGGHALQIWLSQHLNIEIGLGLQSDAWCGARYWEKQARIMDLPDLIERSDVLVAGIDGGGLDDLLGLAVLGRESHTGHWLAWTHAWVHRSVLNLRLEIAPKLLDLEKTGDLTILERMDVGYGQVADYCQTLDDAKKLAKVGLDPVGVSDIVDCLNDRDIGGARDRIEDRVVGVSQGWKLSGTIKTTESRLSDGKIWHGGQALMNWCVGNAKVELTGNATRVTKQASGTAKIDPLMALFNCVSLMGLNPQAPKKSAGQVLIL